MRGLRPAHARGGLRLRSDGGRGAGKRGCPGGGGTPRPYVSYFERLRAAARANSSLLCVGLDPEPDRIPGGAEGALRHCREVVRATAGLVCCYKPNSAFWEQYGPEGWQSLLQLRGEIPSTIPVLLDAKRADIGSTMRAYARTIFEVMHMDAVTVHAYHGSDSLAEFTRYSDRGVYVVCRTSNPGAADLQHLPAPRAAISKAPCEPPGMEIRRPA